MTKFKEMVETTEYNDSDPFHVECLRFCFMDVLQKELDRVKFLWNCHIINKSRKNMHTPRGRPNIIYEQPEEWDAESHHRNVSEDDIDFLEENFGHEFLEHGTLEDFVELFHVLKQDIVMPKNFSEAKALYDSLVHEYDTNKPM